jgi:hypothetical protein
MTRKKNIHTTYNKGTKKWQTLLEGQKKPLANSLTKEAAKTKSIREAKKREVEHVIHLKTGLIQDSDSYGNDPNPPIDKIH